jgi:hypothetical protein
MRRRAPHRIATSQYRRTIMPIIATFTIKGISPYSQSRPHLDEMEPNESHDDYRRRTWRSHLHVNRDGEVIISPGGIKNCISEAAKFMNISVPGKGKATYTKHVEAGTACVRPVALGIHVDDVDSETLFLPADGRRGSGKRVWKQYPIIPEWGGNVEIIVIDETVLQTSRVTGNPVLQDICEGAGQYIGLGRFRPRNNGFYGRFLIENFVVHK